MKSIHFCTPLKLQEIKENIYFDTVRTGFIPTFFPEEIIQINERKDYEKKKDDQFICLAKVLSCKPVVYGLLNKTKHQEEITRYHKKFDHRQYFFEIQLKKMKHL